MKRGLSNTSCLQIEKSLFKNCLFIFSFAGRPPVVKRESGFIHESLSEGISLAVTFMGPVGGHYECSKQSLDNISRVGR
mgnify:CR=1 FL=1